MKIFHLTTVHPRSDTRIWLKEVTTLYQEFPGEVALCVADGRGDTPATPTTASVIDAGELPRGRLRRAVFGSIAAFKKVRQFAPEVVHFHDPELLPLCLLLRLSGYKVVYDVHEDVPKQILSKPWIYKPLRRLIAGGMGLLEAIGGRLFDRIVVVTPKIAQRFPANKTIIVQNFPLVSEFAGVDVASYAGRPAHFGYVGGITSIRGSFEMVEAAGLLRERHVRLTMAGNFQPPAHQAELEQHPAWDQVDFIGWADRKSLAQLLGSVRAGLVLFHPLPNHVDAQPNKLFEYMAAGLPVIASDFPLWRDLVTAADCGILVDPLDRHAIARAMASILDGPEEAEAMGRRGRQAVHETYNWLPESRKLITLYEDLLALS